MTALLHVVEALLTICVYIQGLLKCRNHENVGQGIVPTSPKDVTRSADFKTE